MITREACYPAISCALELLQRERPSKLASGSSFTRLPDKAYTRWNGASPLPRLDEEALAARKEVQTPSWQSIAETSIHELRRDSDCGASGLFQAFSVEYVEEVKRCVLKQFHRKDFLDNFIAALSIIQLGRAR